MEKTRELTITLENQIPKPLNIQFDGSKVGFGFQHVEYTLAMDERLFCDIISIELIDNKTNEYNIIITGRDVEYIDTFIKIEKSKNRPYGKCELYYKDYHYYRMDLGYHYDQGQRSLGINTCGDVYNYEMRNFCDKQTLFKEKTKFELSGEYELNKELV